MPITSEENRCSWCGQFDISCNLRGKHHDLKICFDCAYRILKDAGVFDIMRKIKANEKKG